MQQWSAGERQVRHGGFGAGVGSRGTRAGWEPDGVEPKLRFGRDVLAVRRHGARGTKRGDSGVVGYWYLSNAAFSALGECEWILGECPRILKIWWLYEMCSWIRKREYI